MYFPSFIHIYQIASAVPILDFKVVAEEIEKILPRCNIDIRPPFNYEEKMIEHAKISDIKQPFEKQKNHKKDNTMTTADTTISPYDGFVMQKKLAELIPISEISLDHIHIIFTSLFTCTFSEDDWRYHARAVICGTPSIVSTTGIVEALAKPRELYLAQLCESMTEDNDALKKRFAGRFIDYGDEDKITAASINYSLQAIFFFITRGQPFCSDKDCRLFNAHWQEELIHIIRKRTLCSHHRNLANNLLKDQSKTPRF